MKTQVGTVDATPSKRLYLSIIADYDLNKAICELIDNALDIWTMTERRKPVEITVNLDDNQQTIFVKDNAGGISKSDLPYIVGPGHTSNPETSPIIGIFGVGTKRAVVALAQDIKIKTGKINSKSYQVEFDDNWLENRDDWKLPVYEIDEILNGQTVIELQKLRIKITKERLNYLKKHLQSTYARFLENRDVIIKLNSERLSPILYENWSYPPGYEPRRYTGKLNTKTGSEIDVNVLAGLTLESSPTGGEYGVYFYCNDRLIVKGLKSFDVGFSTGLAGKPHPKISLTRVIVSLNGEAKLMPWNSSKSEINTNHEVFVALQKWLVQVVKDYASLSRRFQGDWPEQVFKYPKGKTVDVKIDNFPAANTSYLPPLPVSRPRYGDIIKQKNKNIAKTKPWTKGIYEGIIAVDLIFKQNLEQKNRICLLLLDSNLEIAFKEYLVNESGHPYNDQQLEHIFKNRYSVHDEVKKYIKIKQDIWKKLDYYYKIRCELIHKRSTATLSDDDVLDYRETVEAIFKKLYKLKFDK